MADNFIHITNGDALTSRLKQFFPEENLITWNEILCEGPAQTQVLSEEFINERSNYLVVNFEGSIERYSDFTEQFNSIDWTSYEAVVLWFEYDLFCQVNLAAVVYYLKNLNVDAPLLLVSSGEIEGTEGLYGLNELNDDQLHHHYKNKVELTASDVALLVDFWTFYSGNDPLAFGSSSFKNDNLKYLEPARLAHIARFPDSLSGINELEKMVLEAISENTFTNERKLIGYLLRNQGFYGFGDLQWEKIVHKMSVCFSAAESITLNSEGEKALNSEINVIDRMRDDTQFGGSSKYDYFYDKTSKKLLPA